MSADHIDREAEQLGQKNGEVLLNLAQGAVMATAGLPLDKPSVEVDINNDGPKQQKDVGHDVRLIEYGRAEGLDDDQIKDTLRQKSNTYQRIEDRHGKGENYLDTVLDTAHQFPGGKLHQAPITPAKGKSQAQSR